MIGRIMLPEVGWKMKKMIGVLVMVSLAPASQAQKQKLPVQILDRQSSETEYTYRVPGYASSNCSASVYGNTASSNCFASGTPASSGSYSVHGATLSLLLPDGRLVVVNCSAKTNWTDWGHPTRYRGCREPITDRIEAEFSGDNAKLEWPVSIDGMKKQDETYKIIGVLTKIPEPVAIQETRKESVAEGVSTSSSQTDIGWIGVNAQNKGDVSVVTNVNADGPGAKAGIQVGDIILALDGRLIKGKDFETIVSTLKPGTQISVNYARGSSAHEVTVTVGSPNR